MALYTINYTIIKQWRKYKMFILHEIKQTDFISTKPLEDAILTRRKNINGEEVIRVWDTGFKMQTIYNVL